MVGVIRVYDTVIPVDKIDSMQFRKYSNDGEIKIRTVGGREYYIRTPILSEEEEEMIAKLILNTEEYIDLGGLVKDVVKSREVSIDGEHKHT